MRHTILFLCPHNAAKSAMAASYRLQLAAPSGLELEVTSAGTEPDATVSPAVVELLHAEGMDAARYRPRRVSREALAQASRVISLGCEVGDLLPPQTEVESWEDVPPPSTQLRAARDAIYAHVERLIHELKGCEL